MWLPRSAPARRLRGRYAGCEGKDLGTLSQTLLENFLKEVFKTFKNFKQGDFCPLLFVVLILMWPYMLYQFRLLSRKIPSSGILSAAVSRLASLPLPDRNGREVR